MEIYQGDRENYEFPGAPACAAAEGGGGEHQLASAGVRQPALLKGIRLGFECSSDHHSTHISYCNVYVEKPTREEILKAMKARHVYGSTDNIVADVRWTAGGEEHFMGEEFTGHQAARVRVHLEGTAPFAKVSIIKDNHYVYTASPKQAVVDFSWTDMEPKAGTSYYYVRGEQEDGELVWVSPVWIHLHRLAVSPAGKRPDHCKRTRLVAFVAGVLSLPSQRGRHEKVTLRNVARNSFGAGAGHNGHDIVAAQCRCGGSGCSIQRPRLWQLACRRRQYGRRSGGDRRVPEGGAAASWRFPPGHFASPARSP